MASVISLSPHSPLGHPHASPSFGNSFSSLGSHGSAGPVRPRQPRQVSLSSLVSGNSLYAPSWYHIRERTPARPASTVAAVGRRSPRRTSISSALSQSRSIAVSSYSDILPQAPSRHQLALSPDVALDAASHDVITKNLSFLHEEDDASEMDVWHDPTELMDAANECDMIVQGQESWRSSISDNQQPTFRRWMSTLRRNTPALRDMYKEQGPPSIICSSPLGEPTESHDGSRRGGHQKSDSHASSIGFVTAIKSASMTIASSSVPSINPNSIFARSPQSRRRAGSSAVSGSDVRRSMDSCGPPVTPVLDDAARKRAIKRMEKVDELVRTEEGYVADIKALRNAFFAILLPQATMSSQVKSALQSNLADLLQLHDELLRDLQAVLNGRDCATNVTPIRTKKIRHIRNRSADAVTIESPARRKLLPIRRKRRSLNISSSEEQESLRIYCSAQTVAEIAKIFLNKIRRFSCYEEYGARCDLIQLDVDFAQRSLSCSQDYDKAIEILYASVNSRKSHEQMHRRALGLKDLLIKPIQRITRYELLFKDLCRLTPSCDDPTSHLILDNVLFAISQTCHNVNDARSNPERLRLMENQRHMQERLCFNDKISESLLGNYLGRLSLCGCLYIVYRTRNGIKGQYVVCTLYESCLVLATAQSPTQYRVIAVAPLSVSKVEESDNGKGLQCHTTPHTWKLVFENSGRLFEILMVGCTAIEASVWRDRISGRIAVENEHLAQGRVVPIEISSPLTDDMRNVGKAYGRCTDFVRRLSVHRAATLGPTTDINQVIIKNTQASKDGPDNVSTSSLPIARSQSVMTPCHIPVLAPRRSERMHLEHILSDVWTKDAIPWPGLGTKRPDYNLRASANHVMRKLSMASIASNFSKRSMSYASVSQASIPEMKLPKPLKPPMKLKGKPPGPDKPYGEQKSTINFHNAPDAFLPEDFDLKSTLKPGRRLGGLGTFTMTTDRPRSPFFNLENKTTEVKRAKSVTSRPTNMRRKSMEPSRIMSPQIPLSPARATSGDENISRTIGNAKAGEGQEKMTTRQRAKSKLMRFLG